jgi:two-component system sensor histidine kinase CpxA
MRSLFAKILLWLVATICVTLTAALLTTALTFSASRPRQMPFGMLLSFQAREARWAYETGGTRALVETLARFEQGTRAEGFLTDRSGRDLATGEDESDLIREAVRGPRLPLFRRERMVLAYQDGPYWYLLMFPRRRLWWFLHPEYLWVAALGMLLCYLLARHLTTPLRQLQAALERLGRGDLSARTNSTRQDELGELARTFDHMAERIQTLMSVERRLLLDISHELRSPLARLGLAVELARTGDDREGAFNRIQKEADRLNALVSQLLEVTRVEADPTLLRREPVRLDELVADIVQDASVEAQARGCRVEFTAPEPARVAGDIELLRRAVENVIRNAIRYAPPDSAVEIRVDQSCVRVRDHGSGVPEEALARIFDPFYRVETDRNRGSGGTGLGLAIARRAVELHGGKIAARNAYPGLLVELNFAPAVISASLSEASCRREV